MTEINQKEYLKKYLSIGTDPGTRKKKKKKKAVGDRVKIIDDDVDVSNNFNIPEEELFVANEDAPQIVGIVDERPPELRIADYRQSDIWQPVGEVINDNSSITQMKKFSILNKQKTERKLDKNFKQEEVGSVNSNDITSRRRKNEGSQPPKQRAEISSYMNSPTTLEKKDLSPSRREDLSPPRKSRREEDLSPTRKSRKEKDLSPPRRSKREKDLSPPRKSKREEDLSPPRKSRREEDLSPPRKSRMEQDLSPPRKSRIVQDSNTPRKSKRESDLSPFSKSNKKDLSPSRKLRRGEDSSSLRKSRGSSVSPGRKEENSKSNNSSRRKERDAGSSPSRKDRKSRWNRSKSPEPKRLKKTLDGKVAGLQNAKELVIETEKFKQRENSLFRNLSEEQSGANAATILRDRKTGRIRNLEEEQEIERKKQEEEDKNKEKYSKWGKGLKQIEAMNEKFEQDLHEMSKPLARYADDEDLEKFLKEQEREDDPMLAYIRKKKKKEDIATGKPLKPTYEGEFMPNRFGIRPGYRWDGVDRSNGYEKKWFEVQNAKRAQQEDVYKWSTEDM